VVEAWPQVREEGKERRRQGLVVEARPPILGVGGERKRKGKDRDAVFVLAVVCYC